MSGNSSSSYPHNPPGYGYGYPGPPGNPYPKPHPQFYAPPPSHAPPSSYPSHSPHAPPSPYSHSSSPYSTASPHAPPLKPPNQHQNLYTTTGSSHPPPHSVYDPSLSRYSSSGLGLGSFPAGTDPNVIACFRAADGDGSGMIDDVELQRALSGYGQRFGVRTVRLLMFEFTGNPNARKIGPKEFTSLFYSLQNWRATFERFDRDRSSKIDTNELREALLSLGFAVSPAVLGLLVSKFDKTGGRGIEYDHFIECCLIVKGLTEKFKAKDMAYSGSATFAYEEFMLTVLSLIIA